MASATGFSFWLNFGDFLNLWLHVDDSVVWNADIHQTILVAGHSSRLVRNNTANTFISLFFIFLFFLDWVVHWVLVCEHWASIIAIDDAFFLFEMFYVLVLLECALTYLSYLVIVHRVTCSKVFLVACIPHIVQFYLFCFVLESVHWCFSLVDVLLPNIYHARAVVRNLNGTTHVVDYVLHLVTLHNLLLGFGCICRCALSDSLDCSDDFLVLSIWVWLLEWVRVSYFIFADFEVQNSFIWAITSPIRTSSHTSVSICTCFPLVGSTCLTHSTLAGGHCQIHRIIAFWILVNN